MFQEFIFVLAYSRRTQLALFFAVLSAVVIWLLGEYLVGRIEFVGPLASLTEVVREKLYHRYDKAALLSLASFVALAARLYVRDRKRLLHR